MQHTWQRTHKSALEPLVAKEPFPDSTFLVVFFNQIIVGYRHRGFAITHLGQTLTQTLKLVRGLKTTTLSHRTELCAYSLYRTISRKREVSKRNNVVEKGPSSGLTVLRTLLTLDRLHTYINAAFPAHVVLNLLTHLPFLSLFHPCHFSSSLQCHGLILHISYTPRITHSPFVATSHSGIRSHHSNDSYYHHETSLGLATLASVAFADSTLILD